MKSFHISDLSAPPGVGQKVSPFSKVVTWCSLGSYLEMLITLWPIWLSNVVSGGNMPGWALIEASSMSALVMVMLKLIDE